MPFAGFKDFATCSLEMKKQGHSEESANKICGSLQAKSEDTKYTEQLTSIEEVTYNKYAAAIGGGQGQGLPRKGDAGRDTCICTSCGETAIHDRGTPCTEQKCPKCGAKMSPSKYSQEVKVFESLEDVEIFQAGKWNKDKYSAKDLQGLCKNFEVLKDVVKPPAKIGHSETQDYLKKEGLPAAGWVDKLTMVGNKVVASFKDVPKVVKDLIDKKAYKRVSAEIYPKYKDPASGKVYRNVLRAVAFLGADVPAVETLSDIASLYSDTNPNGVKVYTFDVAKFNEKGGRKVDKNRYFKIYVDEGMNKEEEDKKKSEITEKLADTFEGEVQVSVEDDAMTEEERKKKELEAAKMTEDAKKIEDDKGIKDKKIEELTNQYEAVTKLQGEKDQVIADLQTKVGELETKAKEVQTSAEAATEELTSFKKNAKSEAIKSFVKQSVGEGKVLPKDENTIVALMEQLDDKSVVKFTQEDKEVSEPTVDILKKFISGLSKVVEFKEVAPQVEHKIYEDKQVSIGGVQYGVENVELVQKAEKYAQDNKVAFDAALLVVSQEV